MDRTPYEKQQGTEIEKWKAQEPSVAAKAFGLLAKPAVWLVQAVVPESALRGAVEAGCKAGNALADSGDILAEGKVSSIPELRKVELERCDELANSSHNWAIGIALAGGAAEGAGGLPGLALGIPATITLAFRTIHEIGLCYGYECNSELDTQFVCGILAASGANSMTEKASALATLQTIRVILLRQTWKTMAAKAAEQAFGREAGIIAIKNLAKQLGVNLTKRKALQVVPVVGAGVGASVNASYIKDVGWAARRSFQERWLAEKYADQAEAA